MQFSTTLTFNANTNLWTWEVSQYPAVNMTPGASIASGSAATAALCMTAAAAVITATANVDMPTADDTI